MKTMITIDVLCIFLDILIPAKNTFFVYYFIVLLSFKNGGGGGRNLAPQPLPLRGPACVFHLRSFFTFTILDFLIIIIIIIIQEFI